jgi:hypothetical protein
MLSKTSKDPAIRKVNSSNDIVSPLIILNYGQSTDCLLGV